MAHHGDAVIDIPDERERHGEDPEEDVDLLHEILDTVRHTAIEVAELRAQMNEMQGRLDTAVTLAERAQTQRELDRQLQQEENEVLTGNLDAVNQAIDRLQNIITRQPEGPFGLNARCWAITKFLAAGGLTLYAFGSDTFTAVSFIKSMIDGNPTLHTLLELYSEDDPLSKARESVRRWVDQPEDAFWKDSANYYVDITKYSLLVQVNNAQMMIYIAGGSPKLNPVMRWPASEKMAVVDGLTKTYLEQGSEAMYLSVTSYKHNDKQLPRVVALDCVSLALGAVIQQLRGQSDVGAQPLLEKLSRPHEMPGHAPKHLEPVFVFKKLLNANLRMEEYAASIMRAWGVLTHVSSNNIDNERALFDGDTTQQPDELDLAGTDAVLATVSNVARRGRLQDFVGQFQQLCSTTYPLLTDESIIDHRLAVLKKPYNIAMPGSLVYVRTTNLAEVVFIVYQLRLEPDNGQQSLKYSPLIVSAAQTPITVNMNFADFFRVYIGPVASTLAFAVPPPWGIPLSAAFTLIDEIFGGLGETGPSLVETIGQLLKQTVDAIKALFLEERIKESLSSVNAFISWTQTVCVGLNHLTSNNEIWIKETLNTLLSVQNPSFSGNIYSSLLFLTTDEVCNIAHDEVIGLAFMAATSLFLSYRLRCQLYSLLASFAADKHRIDDYDQYAGQFYILTAEFQRSLHDWTEFFPKKVDSLIKARLDLVTDLQHYDDRYTSCTGTMYPVCRLYGEEGYLFKDGDTIVLKATDWQTVKDAHDHYVSQLNGSLQDKYADHRKTISNWNASLAGIKAHMPPTEPPPPTITAWAEHPAPDPDLVGQKSVQYLVEFANARGPSSISQGSGFSVIQAGKAPEVSIPLDTEGAATKRVIYRQLIDGQGHTLDREKVDIVVDNTTKTWVDGVKS